MQKAKKGIRGARSMFDVQVKGTRVRMAPMESSSRVSRSQPTGNGSRSHATRARLVWQRERGRRTVRNGIAFEVLIATIVGGNRLAILVALAHGPLSVGAIQRLLGAPSPSHVSEELQRLYEMGLVMWELDGTKHIYQLTHRLRVFEEDGAVQLIVIAEAGHWALLHVDEGCGSGRIVEPPRSFLDASRLAAVRRREAIAGSPGRFESEDSGDRRLKHPDPGAPSAAKRRGKKTAR